MIEADKDLIIKVAGQEVKIPKEDYYFTEDGNTPVIKHGPLSRLARQFGLKEPNTALQNQPLFHEDIPLIIYHAEGEDLQGNRIVQVGEAGPFNVEGIGAQYPATMAFKRAQDRFFIKALGLEGTLYSDVEFASTATNPGATIDETTPFPMGKHKGKPLGVVVQSDRSYAEWFATKFNANSPHMKQIQTFVKDLLAA